jgi:peptidyl-tRNA hydrolase
MTPGKLAAQAAHAEMLAMEYQLLNDKTRNDPLYREWRDSGHYTKLTMLAEDSEHLHNIKEYIEARGYKTFLVIDEGRTEIAPHSPTALAVELVDKDDERVLQHFGDFRSYKEKKPPTKKKRYW